MGNEINVWRFDKTNEPGQVGEYIKFDSRPHSLDEATRQLPTGAYTSFRTYHRNSVLHLAAHFNRLEETARLAGEPVHLDRMEITHKLHQVFVTSPAAELRVRLIVDLSQAVGTIYCLTELLQVPEPQLYQTGVQVITRTMQRQNPKAKLTEFVNTAAGLRDELPVGINEIIMVDQDGQVLEGLSSNFFAVKDGAVWTAEQGVLSGITRQMVLEIIRKNGLEIKLEGIHRSDLPTLNEVFITSASRAVLPVTAIDSLTVGCGEPGPITRSIMADFQAQIERELDTV